MTLARAPAARPGWLLFAIIAAVAGAGSASERGVKRDRYGDPLPQGAVARFGTVRFLPRAKVWALALSPDGKTVATGSSPGTWPAGDVELWNASTAQRAVTLLHGVDNIFSLAWSPDGRRLAVSYDRPPLVFFGRRFDSGRECRVELFDVAGRKSLGTLETPAKDKQHGYWCVSWSRDGRWIAARRSTVHEVCLWDAATRKLKHSAHYPKDLHGIAFSADSRSLAVCGNGILQVRDVATFHVRLNREEIPDEIHSIAFSPDGKTLAGCVYAQTKRPQGTEKRPSDDVSRVRFWDAATARPEGETAPFEGIYAEVAYLPDGKIVATGGGWRGVVRLWDTSTRKERARLELRGYVGQYFSISADGSALATADRRIMIWDLGTCKPRHQWDTHGGVVTAVCFAPDGRTIFSGGSDGIRCWDRHSARLLRRIPVSEVGVGGMALSHDGRMLAAGVAGSDIILWDARSAKVLARLSGHGNEGSSFSAVRCLVFSPNDSLLASAGMDKTIRLWDTAERKEVRKLELPEYATRVRISPDGKTLAAGMWFKDVRLFDLPGANERGLIANSSCLFGDCDFVAGGPWIAVNRVDPTAPVLRADGVRNPTNAVRLWEYERGKQLWASRPLLDPMAIASSHRGRLVVAACGFGEVTLSVWSAKTGRLVKEFRGHMDGVQALSFSPEDSQILSGGQDGTLLLWDLPPLPEK